MKKLFLISITGLGIFLYSCTQPEKPKESSSPEQIVEKPDIKVNSDLMTPEILWSFGRVSGSEVSPDGKTVLYGVTYYSIDQNKGNRELYLVDINGENQKQLTHSAKSEFNEHWRPDGKKIGFLTSESGSVQFWEMNPDGSGRIKISDVGGGITGFMYASDQSKILYTKDIPIENKFSDLYKGLPDATGQLYDDLMYRHWDHWVDSYSHVFVADYDGSKLSNDKDIMQGEPYESPMAPFGGMEQITFSPDGKTIAYTCKKLTGKEATLWTNSDIYLYDIASGKTTNMTEGMMGFDINPTYSPDGNFIAWQSMERNGYESDKDRLFVMNLQTGEKKYATKDFDQNAGSLFWASDSKSIFFTSDWHGTFQIYRYNLDASTIDKLTEGLHDYVSVAQAGDLLVAPMESMSFPTELFAVNPKDGSSKQLTFTNKDLLDKLTMGRVEERWMKTKDNKDMLTMIIYPPHFDSTAKVSNTALL